MFRKLRRFFRKGPFVLGRLLVPTTPVIFLNLPNELILQISEHLGLKDLNSLLRTNHFLVSLLSPILLNRAANSVLRRNSRPVLHWASAHNRVRLVTLLLERVTQISVNNRDSHGQTALHSAILLGNLSVVKLLLQNGADIEMENEHGWTPLQCASIAGEDEVARLLLKNGAKANSKGSVRYGGTALHYAVALGRVGVAGVLIDMGGNVTKYRNWLGMNAIQIAVAVGPKEMARRLLDFAGLDTAPKVTSYMRRELRESISIVRLNLKHYFFVERNS